MHVEPLENPAVNTTQEPRRALILCYSNLEADPRVTRQIDWLASCSCSIRARCRPAG